MFYIDGGDIYIHRGDSASFDLVFGEMPHVNWHGKVNTDSAVIDAFALPSLGAQVIGKKLSISVDPGSFPVYNYPAHTIMVKDVFGVNWVPEDGTPIRISVKCNTGKLKAVIQKDYYIYNGFVCVDLTPRDTRFLPFGEYDWDFRISFDNADMTEWNTPINPCKFIVCEVVGNV